MVDQKVKEIVLSIIEQEKDRDSVNWKKIEIEADAAISYINDNGLEADNTIYHFLEDADARRKSEAHALYQTTNVLKALGG